VLCLLTPGFFQTIKFRELHKGAAEEFYANSK